MYLTVNEWQPIPGWEDNMTVEIESLFSKYSKTPEVNYLFLYNIVIHTPKNMNSMAFRLMIDTSGKFEPVPGSLTYT